MADRAMRDWASALAAAALAGGYIIAGCNMITGADDIVFVDGVAPGSSGEAGVGGASSGNGSGASSGSGTGQGGAVQLPMDAVDGVSLSSIVVYQAVARPIMNGGAPANSNVPIIAERPALFRVFYTADGSYNGLPVTARLTLGSSPPVEKVATLGGSSTENNPGSTINIEVPAELMQAGVGYRLELLQPVEQSTGQNTTAQFPAAAGEQANLGAQNAGVLKVTLVPIQYNGDGSGRLPDTSAAQIQKYKDLFFGIYPVSEIDLQVHGQVGYGGTVSSGGSGWSSLLNAIADLRQNDGAGFDEYYYGIFEPASSFSNYCGGGCVLGLGFIGEPQDEWSHSAIGVGFTGDTAANTAVHELGHNHGRQHAPCGTSGDGNYPYGGASIGVWGFDLVNGVFLDPDEYTDMMSYCSPRWISDYNYRNIFERIQFVTGASIYTPPSLMNLTYQRVLVEPNGGATLMTPITLQHPPAGEAVNVTVQTSAGSEQKTGQLIRYDHIDGGVLFVPPASQPAQMLSAVIDNFQLVVTP